MKKIILAAILWAMMGSAKAGTLFENYALMLGIDYKWTRATLIDDWNHLFAESFPGVSVYASMKLIDYLGVELGYDMTARKGKDRKFIRGDSVGGVSVTADPTAISGYNASLRFAGPHLDLVGFLPVDSHLELFFSLGYARIKPAVNITNISATPLSGADANFNEAITSVRGQHHITPRVGLGANWAITDAVGFRVKILWEELPEIALKDNVSVGVPAMTILQPWSKGYSFALGFFIKH